jgi:hypothetical protein
MIKNANLHHNHNSMLMWCELYMIQNYATSWKELLCQCMKLSEPKDAKIYTKEAIDNNGHLLYKYIIRKINLSLQWV